MMEFIPIITLVLLFTASILLVVWLYRPGSSEKFDHYSKIPLSEDKRKEEIKGVRKAKKRRKK